MKLVTLVHTNLNVALAVLNCAKNVPAQLRVQLNGLLGVAIVHGNCNVRRMRNRQRYLQFLAGQLVVQFSLPRTPRVRFDRTADADAVQNTATAVGSVAVGLPFGVHTRCGQAGFRVAGNQIEFVFRYQLYKMNTHVLFSVFRKLMVIFERGLNAAISRYGECT